MKSVKGYTLHAVIHAERPTRVRGGKRGLAQFGMDFQREGSE